MRRKTTKKYARRVKRLGEALTASEQFIWALIASGASNKEIAFQRDVTEAAISKVLRDLFEKTGMRERVKLALLWHGVDADSALTAAATLAAAKASPAREMEMAA